MSASTPRAASSIRTRAPRARTPAASSCASDACASGGGRDAASLAALRHGFLVGRQVRRERFAQGGGGSKKRK